jgi:hypothetical protein
MDRFFYWAQIEQMKDTQDLVDYFFEKIKLYLLTKAAPLEESDLYEIGCYVSIHNLVDLLGSNDRVITSTGNHTPPCCEKIPITELANFDNYAIEEWSEISGIDGFCFYLSCLYPKDMYQYIDIEVIKYKNIPSIVNSPAGLYYRYIFRVEKEYYQALFYASLTFDKKLYVHVNKVVKLHKINLSDIGETS